MSPASKRRRLALVALVCAFLVLCSWTGRASIVTPPALTKEPVTVRLLSTGRHAGLLLPGSDGRTVEYGYGDWDWYALAKDDWWRAPATVLWPNQGTLGRRRVRDEDLATLGNTYGGATLTPIRVSKADAERLLAKLDAEFAAAGEPLYNRRYDMWFVRHPASFWFLHDCHDEAAVWLREMGCSVSWAPIRTGLRLPHPPSLSDR